MNLQIASDTLQRLAAQYQGILEAQAALQDLGGLANAKDELEAQVALLRAQVEKLKEEHSEAGEDMVTAKAAVREALDDAKAEADRIIEDAADQAKALIDVAKDQAKKVADEAAANAEAAKVSVTSQLSALQSKAQELADEIEGMEAKRVAVEESAAAAQAKLDSVKAQLQKLIAE